MGGNQNARTDRGTTRVLTEVITRLRRTLRTSIRADYPWETLPMAQIELLMALQDNQPSRIGELANILRLAPNTVSGLVQQLVDTGFVHRGPAADRRVAVVTLTPAGDRQLLDWDHAHQQRIGVALDALDPADRAAIDAALPALGRLVGHLGNIRT